MIHDTRTISERRAWLLIIVTLWGAATCDGASNASPTAGGGNTGTDWTNTGGSGPSGGASSLAATWQTGGNTGTPATTAVGGQTATGSAIQGTAGSTCMEHVHLASGRLGTNCASCHKAACNCYLSELDAELTCPQ